MEFARISFDDTKRTKRTFCVTNKLSPKTPEKSTWNCRLDVISRIIEDKWNIRQGFDDLREQEKPQ